MRRVTSRTQLSWKLMVFLNSRVTGRNPSKDFGFMLFSDTALDNIWRLSRGVMVMGNIFENVNNDLLLRSDCFLQNSPRLRSQWPPREMHFLQKNLFFWSFHDSEHFSCDERGEWDGKWDCSRPRLHTHQLPLSTENYFVKFKSKCYFCALPDNS